MASHPDNIDSAIRFARWLLWIVGLFWILGLAMIVLGFIGKAMQ